MFFLFLLLLHVLLIGFCGMIFLWWCLFELILLGLLSSLILSIYISQGHNTGDCISKPIDVTWNHRRDLVRQMRPGAIDTTWYSRYMFTFQRTGSLLCVGNSQVLSSPVQFYARIFIPNQNHISCVHLLRRKSVLLVWGAKIILWPVGQNCSAKSPLDWLYWVCARSFDPSPVTYRKTPWQGERGLPNRTDDENP